MDNLLLTFNIISPLIIYLLLGILLKKLHIMEGAFQKKFSGFVSKVILPCSLFNSLYKTDFSGLAGQGYALYVLVANIIAIIFLWGFCKLFVKDAARTGSIIQACTRCNSAIFGLPLCIAIMGPDNTAETAICVALMVTFYNIFFVLELQYYGSKAKAEASRGAGEAGETGGRIKVNFKELLADLYKNPLLDSVVLAIVVNLLKIPVPGFIKTPISNIGACISPMAFIMIGAGLSLKRAASDKWLLVFAVTFKLVIFSGLGMIIPIMNGWSAEKLVALIAVFATPTAITSYPMSSEFGCDAELTGEIVAATTALSMFTIFLWVFGLKQAGLI